jgi:hypothetical protein
MNSTRSYIFFIIISLIINACSTFSASRREEGKIFHAAPMSGGIGALSFGLYNDSNYEICNSGGLGQFCYSGEFKLNRDTLTLIDLHKDVPLKSNKFLILRYAEQDSTYWEWKYSRQYTSFSADRKLGKWIWQQFKGSDLALGEGDIYQLDNNGIPIKDEYHFIIRFDSLRNYR